MDRLPEPGERVVWRYASRAGYGYDCREAAVVESVSPKRVRIRIARKSLGVWAVCRRNVKLESIFPRCTDAEPAEAETALAHDKAA